jgi:poly-gamma-glutamate synthesis protein (capsule biosynthesis protein)
MKKDKVILLLIVSILFSCKYSKPITPAENNAEIIAQEQNIRRYSLTLLATGDNLFHETIITSSRRGNTYNFTPIYSEIKSLVENADLAFINQETVMAGEAFGYSGYPTFNTPQVLAKTLADTGFDIVNQANNHAMDMGKAGLVATLDLWDTIEGITVIGARKEGESARIITKNNITLGFLSYAHSLNGIPLPADSPNLVSMNNRNRMAREIDALRPLCDFLIVSMHWGDEYELIEPVKSQVELAKFIAEHNVDLIIGHHPHVLQRFEKLPRPDGKETFCFYSLGNFVSNQREKERIIGAMMLVTFTKEESELNPAVLSISNSGLIPVICHFEQYYANTKVYPLYSYTEELLEKHILRREDKGMDFGFFNSVIFNLDTKLIMYNPF